MPTPRSTPTTPMSTTRVTTSPVVSNTRVTTSPVVSPTTTCIGQVFSDMIGLDAFVKYTYTCKTVTLRIHMVRHAFACMIA